MHEQWAGTEQETQYAEYLAYTGLSAAPTMNAVVHNQHDRNYPHQLNAAAPDYCPESLQSFASYLPYITFVEGQIEAEGITAQTYQSFYETAHLAQLAQSYRNGNATDSQVDNDGDEYIMQELLYVHPLSLDSVFMTKTLFKPHASGRYAECTYRCRSSILPTANDR